jgi:hypothetical protein
MCDRWPRLTGKAPGRSERIIARFPCDFVNSILGNVNQYTTARKSLTNAVFQSNTHASADIDPCSVETLVSRPKIGIYCCLSRLRIKNAQFNHKSADCAKKTLHLFDFKTFVKNVIAFLKNIKM